MAALTVNGSKRHPSGTRGTFGGSRERRHTGVGRMSQPEMTEVLGLQRNNTAHRARAQAFSERYGLKSSYAMDFLQRDPDFTKTFTTIQALWDRRQGPRLQVGDFLGSFPIRDIFFAETDLRLEVIDQLARSRGLLDRLDLPPGEIYEYLRRGVMMNRELRPEDEEDRMDGEDTREPNKFMMDKVESLEDLFGSLNAFDGRDMPAEVFLYEMGLRQQVPTQHFKMDHRCIRMLTRHRPRLFPGDAAAAFMLFLRDVDLREMVDEHKRQLRYYGGEEGPCPIAYALHKELPTFRAQFANLTDERNKSRYQAIRESIRAHLPQVGNHEIDAFAKYVAGCIEEAEPVNPTVAEVATLPPDLQENILAMAGGFF